MTLTRDELVTTLFTLGFKPQTTASRKWKQALYFFSGEKSLFVLVRARGIDLLETPLRPNEMTNRDGFLSVSMHRPGDRFAEYFYTDSHLPIHERVLEIASQFVKHLNIDECHFQNIGIGRREWRQKYGRQSQSLCALYGELAVEDYEDVYLFDGVWLSSDGTMHDQGQ